MVGEIEARDWVKNYFKNLNKYQYPAKPDYELAEISAVDGE